MNDNNQQQTDASAARETASALAHNASGSPESGGSAKSTTKPVKNRTKTRPVHNQATARIYIDGLAIMCFNQHTQLTETVFVKDHHDPVELRVFDRHCALIYSYDAPANGKVRIDIKKMGALHAGDIYYEDNKGNDEDFRWMPDLCEWYNKPAMQFFPNAKDHLSAKLVMQDAIFYTRKKSKVDADLVNWPTPRPPQKVGRIVGANIICGPNDQGISIETTDDGRHDFLAANGPYRITIRTEPHDTKTNHMEVVYDHILDLQGASNEYFLHFECREKPLVYRCSKDDFEEMRDGREHGDHGGDKSSKATEYACQPHGGGNGDPPPFP